MRPVRVPLCAALAFAASALLPTAAGASSKPVWLCKPGLAANPCTPGLATTRFSQSGVRLGVRDVRASQRPAFDCFYVYPTVSDQPTIQATRRIDPEERSIALYQAARYSRDCRVYAPMYRQITLAGLGRRLPYRRRRELLDELALESEHWKTPPGYPAGRDDLAAVTRAHGLEGVVAKRYSAPYMEGRRAPGAWRSSNTATSKR